MSLTRRKFINAKANWRNEFLQHARNQNGQDVPPSFVPKQGIVNRVIYYQNKRTKCHLPKQTIPDQSPLLSQPFTKTTILKLDRPLICPRWNLGGWGLGVTRRWHGWNRRAGTSSVFRSTVFRMNAEVICDVISSHWWGDVQDNWHW
jgi:hypothetical protein